jgi:hypothetical protein
MKVILISILLFSISSHSFSQILEGEWKGSCDAYNKFNKRQNYCPSMKLKFVLNNDSSYSVHSFSEGKNSKGLDTIVVCKVFYKQTAADSIYLEELEVLAPQNLMPICLQRMYLKVIKRDKAVVLNGLWESVAEKCQLYGTISFRKKEMKTN